VRDTVSASFKLDDPIHAALLTHTVHDSLQTKTGNGETFPKRKTPFGIFRHL